MIGFYILHNEDDFPRHPFANEVLEPVLGKGLSSVSGEDWKRLRAIINPMFYHNNLRRMGQCMAKVRFLLLKVKFTGV